MGDTQSVGAVRPVVRGAVAGQAGSRGPPMCMSPPWIRLVTVWIVVALLLLPWRWLDQLHAWKWNLALAATRLARRRGVSSRNNMLWPNRNV